MTRPVQYLEGSVEFFGRTFATDARALIPRFETEFLVRKVVEYCRQESGRAWHIIELGTGSGIIAISLALELPDADITAVDISADALALARENAIRHDIGERVRFVQDDLLAGFDGPADIIVANLPYIPTARIPQLDASVRDFEPHTALDGGDDGMQLYRRLFSQIAARAQKPALCVFEFDEGQEDIARAELAKYLPEATVTILPDTSGLTRYIVLTFNTTS